MPKFLPPENLTREQSEVLEKAAFLIISARNEGRTSFVPHRSNKGCWSDRSGLPCRGFVVRADGGWQTPLGK
jgi:hypothetical protein